MASTNPARGTRDFLPADVRKREYVIGIIKQVYESYGFEPLETPAVENIETLMGKYGEEGNQLIFKILKRGEKLAESVESGESGLTDLALRYDLTVPLARVVANRRNDIPKFFKRYQIQPVWRADRPARSRGVGRAHARHAAISPAAPAERIHRPTAAAPGSRRLAERPDAHHQ